jgi:hypothetical protein
LKWFVHAANSSAKYFPQLALIPGVNAVIVGDPFCSRRLSPEGFVRLPSLCKEIRSTGCQVWLMTPVYLCQRELNDLIGLIENLFSETLLDGIVLHDIGLLSECARFPNLGKGWDRFGFGRDHLVNIPQLQLLKDYGVQWVELAGKREIPLCSQVGITAALSVSKPDMASFGRRCYTEYASGTSCKDCLCASEKGLGFSDQDGRKLYAEGYLLLWSQRMLSIDPFPHPKDDVIGIIHARNAEDASEIINKWHIAAK